MYAAALGALADKGLKDELLAAALTLYGEPAVRDRGVSYPTAVSVIDKLDKLYSFRKRPTTSGTAASAITHLKNLLLL